MPSFSTFHTASDHAPEIVESEPIVSRAGKPLGHFIVPLIVGCALFMEMLDSTVIVTALPAMARSLHHDPIRLNLAITSYLLSLAVFIPISGWVADKFGARDVFRCAILLFTVGSALCGLSHSLLQLVAFRFIQGFGGAMMMPVGRLVVLRAVPRSDLLQAMSYLTVPSMLGPVVGPPVGGFIVTYFSWRWIFYINVPICVIGIVLVTLFIPDIREENVGPLDWTGFLLTGIGLAGLVFGFECLGRGVIPLPLVLSAIIGGIAFTALYVVHGARTPHPIINLHLMKIPTFAATIVAGGLFRMGMGAIPFLLALLLQVGFGLSAFASGLLIFANAAGAVAMKFAVYPIIRQFGFRMVLIVNGAITAASVAVLALFRISTPHSALVMVLLIGGMIQSLQFTGLNALAYADVPDPLMSHASSLASMAQQLSVTLGVTFVALTLHLELTLHGEKTLTPSEISPVFVFIAGLLLLSVVFFLSLEKHAGAELSGRSKGQLSSAANG